VGVSGGISAYKSAELVRALQRQSIEVHVVMTEAACRFIQPLTFVALTGHKVITSLWDETGTSAYDSSIEHIGEAQWADALVVAPATANILAKFAHGIADDFLTTLYLATRAPVLVAPAMNVNMWEHAATQANLETCASVASASSIRARANWPAAWWAQGAWPSRGHCRGRAERRGTAQRPGRRGGSGHCRRHARSPRPGPLPRQPLQRQDGLRPGRCRESRGAKVILVSGPPGSSSSALRPD